jgi:hypothetical protein
VEAGDYNNPILLNLEEYSIRKAPDPGAPPSSMDDRKVQCIFRNRLNGRIDRQREALPKLRTDIRVPRVRFLRSASASDNQTIGSFTAS